MSETPRPETPAEPVLIDVVDDVLRVRINRPEAKGSLPAAAVRAIVEAVEQAAVEDRVRVIVLSSTGDDFCSGADVVSINKPRDGQDDEDAPRPKTGNLQRRTAFQAHHLIDVLLTVQIPVVCVVRGWAAGLGFQLALAADFTIASETARFWEPFCPRGFTPDSGATWLLPRLVGVARAKEVLMLGRELSGIEAAEWGMILRSVPDDELDTVAEELVEQLASGPTVALGLTKRCIQGSLVSGVVEAMQDEAFALELSSRTKDFREGLTAFRERRCPDFKGL